MRFAVCSLLLVILLFPAASSGAGGPEGISSERIESDAVWKGEVLVEKLVTVAKDVTLTVSPGTVVRFKRDAGLAVEGVLKAVGSADKPVSFISAEPEPARGDWQGISLNNAGEGTVLENCRVEYAGSLSITACSPAVRGCEFSQGIQGIVAARKAEPLIEGNRIHDMETGGVGCQMGSAPTIKGNTLENCGKFGVAKNQDAQPHISDNVITGCETGISLGQAALPLEGNTVKGNKTGILATNCGKELAIRGNQILDNDAGIVCQQFSGPLVEKNTITGNKVGLVCFMASSPMIRNNNVYGNEDGISCIQICNPVITLNDIHGNGKGIYLDLSSYALIHENNIYDNTVQLELGNMSSDWEYKVNQKPVRGGQAQNLTMAQRGRAVAQPVKDNAPIMGSVDATGNWWGEDVTKEMADKGPDADIASFKDYFDVPIRTYEGYEGEYVQDRIKYEGWKSSRVKDAGI